MVSSTHEHHDWLRKKKFAAPVRQADVEADWRPRGFSCQEFVDPPGAPQRAFRHASDELIVLVSGSLEVVIGGDRVPLQPGDEAFVPAGTQLSTANTGEGEARWIYGYA